jgi:signal transduction histidine kinase
VDAYTALLQRAAQLSPAFATAALALYAWDAAATVLAPLASHGVSRSEHLMAMAQQYRDSPLEAALHGGRARLSVSQAPAHAETPFSALVRRERIQAGLALPLIQDGRVLGVLLVGWRTAPSQADTNIADMVAAHAATTLAYARVQPQLDQVQQAAALEERQRLARDLHDSVTQTLFSLQYAAQSAWDSWESQPAHAHAALEMVLHLAQGANLEMRSLLLELRPGALGDEGIADALEKHLEMVRHRSDLQVDLQIEGALQLPCAHQEALYRLVQEALANVVKHARATHAQVSLSVAEMIRLQIEDDGVGLDGAGPRSDSFGLQGMRERVSQLGGSLRLGNCPEGGALVQVEIPLPEDTTAGPR